MIPKANLEKGPSEDHNRWMAEAILGMACALVIGMVFWFADPTSMQPAYTQAKDAPYNLLVQGFRAGQLNLNEQPPPGLATLSNPYNPESNAQDLGNLIDMSYYRGKVYMYFGVTPALVLYWPYVVVTGHYLPDKAAVVIFFVSGFLIAAALLHDLWRRYLSNVSGVMAATGMFTLVLALTLTLWCHFNLVAMFCGFAFTMLALWGTWRALHEPKGRVWWILLASLAYGLAVGARPSLIFGGIILLLPVAQAWRGGSWRQAGCWLAAAAGPAMLIGLGLMLYNKLRFDNPFEFGWHYQLQHQYDATTARQFSAHFLWFNFRFYFLEPLCWSSHFPFLRSGPLPPLPSGYDATVGNPGAGLLANYPFVILALAAPLVWRGRPQEEAWVLRWFMAVIFLLFIVFALMICLYLTATDRYEMDFLPALIILAVAGILGLERALAGSLRWRWVARGGIGLLLVYSLVYDLLVSIEAHATAHYFMGNDSLAKDQLDGAVIQYHKSLALWPDYADANAGLGNVLFQKGQIDQAIVLYQKALEVQPDNPKVHNNLGYCLLQKGQLDQAIFQLQKAVELRPDSLACYNLGNALFQKGDIPGAMIQFKKAVDLNPDFAEACCNLGNCLFREGRADEAIAPYQRALEIKPDFPEARANLGFCLLQAGRVDDAIIQYQKAIEQQPNFPEAYNNLGNAFRLKGNGTEAVAAYQKAIDLEPGFVPPLTHLAWMLATWPDGAIRDGSKAVTLAEKASVLSRGVDPQVLRTLAAAYAEAGRFAEAVSAAQKAQALATAQSNATLANELRTEIGLYQNHSPYRSNN
jgi:tetratricopeptide (TPR) repeat protein